MEIAWLLFAWHQAGYCGLKDEPFGKRVVQHKQQEGQGEHLLVSCREHVSRTHQGADIQVLIKGQFHPCSALPRWHSLER